VLAFFVAAAVCACGTTAAAIATPRTGVPSALPTSVTAPATAPALVATLASCSAPRQLSGLTTMHRFSVSPDDIAVDATGGLWVTARSANLLVGMSATGSAVSGQTVGGGPEGIAADSGTLYIAQQDLNAIAAVASGIRTVISFPNRTSNAGIDGIAVDAAHRRLLVPDSPTGQLFAVNLSGSATLTLLSAGLGRPVAAATDPSGNVFVASESSPGLTVLSSSGARRTLGGFTNLDEVVWYAGLLYVSDLDHRSVVAVDPSTGASVPVAVGLPAPQGLAVTPAGTLEIVDATTNTLYSTPACGVAA
jgi:hypothetical protein